MTRPISPAPAAATAKAHQGAAEAAPRPISPEANARAANAAAAAPNAFNRRRVVQRRRSANTIGVLHVVVGPRRAGCHGDGQAGVVRVVVPGVGIRRASRDPTGPLSLIHI